MTRLILSIILYSKILDIIIISILKLFILKNNIILVVFVS